MSVPRNKCRVCVEGVAGRTDEEDVRASFLAFVIDDEAVRLLRLQQEHLSKTPATAHVGTLHELWMTKRTTHLLGELSQALTLNGRTIATHRHLDLTHVAVETVGILAEGRHQLTQAVQ